MTPDAAGIEAALAAGLAAHAEFLLKRHADNPWRYDGTHVCTCGAEFMAAHGIGGAFVAHRAHVAAALLPVVTQAQAGALREAADALGGFPTTIDGSYGAADFCGEFAAWLRARADESGGAK